MPMIKGMDHKVVSENIKEMMKSGHKKKQAVAAALAMKRKSQKMSNGGMVDDDEDYRSLEELMIEGDQHGVENPKEEDMQKHLAQVLAKGGLVESMDGDGEPEVHHSSSEEPMSDEAGHVADDEHSVIEGVPMSMALSEEAKKAIAAKKMKRKFAR